MDDGRTAVRHHVGMYRDSQGRLRHRSEQWRPAGSIKLVDAVWLLADIVGIEREDAAGRLVAALAVERLAAWSWNDPLCKWGRADPEHWRALKRRSEPLPADELTVIDEAAFYAWIEAGMPIMRAAPGQSAIKTEADDDIIPFPADDEAEADEPNADPQPRILRVSTAAAVTAATEYQIGLMRSGPRLAGKTAYLDACLARYEGLTPRGARTAWDKAIEATEGQRHPSWSKRGPLKRSR
jgi:hypothetical protein